MTNLRKRARRIACDDEAADAFNVAQADQRYALFRLTNAGIRASLVRALTSCLARMETDAQAVCSLLAYVGRQEPDEAKARMKEAASRR